MEQAKTLILEAMRGIDGVLREPAPDVLARELGDSSVVLRARWWTDSKRADVMRVHDQVIVAIKKTLDANEIDIPFPIRTVYFHDESEQANAPGSQNESAYGASTG